MQDIYGNEFLKNLAKSSSPGSAATSDASRMEGQPASWESPAAPLETGEPGSSVGLVVRGKQSPEHKPAPTETHADVLLSNGMPVGFFGQGTENPGPLQGLGLGMPGRVSDPTWWETYDADLDGVGDRAAYLDGDLAESWDWRDTLCELDVTPEQAAAFDQYWAELSADPGTFSYVGGNCSTHAAEAFEAAGLISSGIPGLDTPDALYDLLLAEHGDSLRCQSGYIDFEEGEDGSWDHTVRAPSP